MIGAHGRVPVFAYRRPVDLRKGFEGLSALVREALAQDPLSGALYLFTNRRRSDPGVILRDRDRVSPTVSVSSRGSRASSSRCEAEAPYQRAGLFEGGMDVPSEAQFGTFVCRERS